LCFKLLLNYSKKCFIFVAMSAIGPQKPEDGVNQVSMEGEAKPEDEAPPDTAKKRSRGPSDCLNYSDSEDEFVPFTQENPEVVTSSTKKVFAKKSAPKRSKSKNPRKSSSVSKGSKISTEDKGKCTGEIFYYLIVLICFHGVLYWWIEYYLFFYSF